MRLNRWFVVSLMSLRDRFSFMSRYCLRGICYKLDIYATLNGILLVFCPVNLKGLWNSFSFSMPTDDLSNIANIDWVKLVTYWIAMYCRYSYTSLGTRGLFGPTLSLSQRKNTLVFSSIDKNMNFINIFTKRTHWGRMWLPL